MIYQSPEKKLFSRQGAKKNKKTFLKVFFAFLAALRDIDDLVKLWPILL